MTNIQNVYKARAILEVMTQPFTETVLEQLIEKTRNLGLDISPWTPTELKQDQDHLLQKGVVVNPRGCMERRGAYIIGKGGKPLGKGVYAYSADDAEREVRLIAEGLRDEYINLRAAVLQNRAPALCYRVETIDNSVSDAAMQAGISMVGKTSGDPFSEVRPKVQVMFWLKDDDSE